MIHQLKTEAAFFEDVTIGKKPFEVRRNDRGFKVGDFLALNELAAHECNDEGDYLPTGRCCLVEVTYVLTDNRYVQDGYAVLGIRPCSIGRTAHRMEYNQPERFYQVPVYDAQEGAEDERL